MIRLCFNLNSSIYSSFLQYTIFYSSLITKYYFFLINSALKFSHYIDYLALALKTYNKSLSTILVNVKFTLMALSSYNIALCDLVINGTESFI